MKLNKNNRKFIEYICIIIGFINPIIPKNKNKIFIFNRTVTFQNNYAMYKYLIKNKYNDSYKIIYSMPEIRLYEKKEENVYFCYGLLKSMIHYVTSKYIFLDTGNLRIKPAKKQNVINLWHGTPFKRIGLLSKNIKQSDFNPKFANAFSKIVVSSDNLDDIYIKSFNLNESQILHSGHPRNNLLSTEKDILRKIGIEKNKYSKILMWMTTYRKSKDGRANHTSNQNWSETNLPLIKNEEKLYEFNELLKKYNILLIIKMHTTSEKSKIEINDMSNIKIIEEREYINKDIQLYELVGSCDGIITDYSSIFIDYLLINKPIAFIIEDIDDYENSNGFNMEEPLKYMPGYKINDMNDMNHFLRDFSNNKDKFECERLQVNKFFNQYNDIDNCKYILETIGIVKKGD